MGLSSLRPLAVLLLCFLCSKSLAQAPAHILITSPIDESQLTVLKGNTHPLARAEFDQEAAPANLSMNRMLLVLKRSDDQETALRSLIDAQQDKTSPNYHKWLTPEDFGAQFGPSDSDIQQVVSWLQSHGFQIAQVGKGRTTIEFSGTAAQVQEAFHTAIHKYVVKGEEHWANASDPQIPTALVSVVGGVESLNSFPRKPMLHVAGVVSRSKATGKITPLNPLFTIPSANCGVQASDCYGVGPYDFATIYSVASLWSAAPAIDGTGQTIAIVGETDINPQDVADFRNFFGLPPLTGSQLNIIHNGPAPGILTDGEETESDLDVEWSSAVAKGATIDFVVSESTETTAGVDLSAEYIVDNNVAPVLSESYGLCELGLGTAGNSFYSQLWQQAAAEGITVLIASGDSGSAGCNSQDSSPPSPATFGLAVSGFASTPYNVAVGGTDFNDLTNASSYWSSSNNSTTQASALSYIPETTWNNSCTNPVFGTLLGFSTNAETNCNDSVLGDFLVTVGGSGGKSNCTVSDTSGDVSSCSTGYPKPSWQTGSGVPPDGVRDIPDVSLFAASGSPSGSFYIICEADQVSGGSSCAPADASTEFLGVGGTSASAPAFAGIMALVNQKTPDRQGNANYVLYKLAATPGVFNDVPAGGTIAMPCQTGSPNCNTAVAGHPYGVLTGYTTGTGYDLATGLGSVNVANLVNKWNTVSFNASTTTLNTLSPTSITHGAAVNVSIKVTGSAGIATGTVALSGGPSGNEFIDSHVLDNTGTATWTTKLLPGGSYSVHAHYAGDGNYGASDSTTDSVIVAKEASSAQIQVVIFNPGTGEGFNVNTVQYGAPYLLRVNVLNAAASACTNVPAAQSGCPSGTVAITNNGSALDAGNYVLNNLGYSEDQSIQLPGGVASLKAVYSGDASYVGSTSPTDTVTVTPSPTTASLKVNGTAAVGNQLQVSITIVGQGSGVAPTGTVVVLVNGNPIAGTVTYTPVATPGAPTLQANFTSMASPFPKTGLYGISADYSGDANYSSLNFNGPDITVAYPPPTVTVQSSATGVAPGSVINLTALIASISPTIAPTGTVTISSSIYGTIPGAVTYTTITDKNGNLDLQATVSYAIKASDAFTAVYSGDANYPTSTGTSGLIAVTGSDFSMALPGTMTVMQGQSMGMSVTVGMQASTPPVTFGVTPCSGLPAETTCTVNPGTISSSGTAVVTIQTTAPHSLANKRIAGRRPPTSWIASFGMFSAGILIFSLPGKRRRLQSARSFAVLSLLAIGMGCGGGGSSTPTNTGTSTDPGTSQGNYEITLTATSGSNSHSAQFILLVIP